jgi:arsenate reductase
MLLKILILCTGNSCRSQMTEGFLESLDARLEVHSAGTNPSARVHPLAVEVMKEVGIDISKNQPKNVRQFLDQSFDFVVTVCGEADESCPNFTGKVGKRLHIGFDDPAKSTDIQVFRRVRDEIRARFTEFYEKEIKSKL